MSGVNQDQLVLYTIDYRMMIDWELAVFSQNPHRLYTHCLSLLSWTWMLSLEKQCSICKT